MKHFKRAEFECKCGCGFDVVDFEILEVLEDLREHFNKPLIITSGCRCEAHNTKVGGSKHSKHKLAIAADVTIKDVKADQVADYLEDKYPDKYGIGRYASWTHIDIRGGLARWDKR